MRFKYWFYINEAISEKDKQDVLNSKLYANEKDLNVKSKLDQLLSDLESDEKTYSKGEIFKKIGEVIPKMAVKKEKPKEEDAQRKHFASMQGVTQEELLAYDYYKGENKETINEMMTLLRRFVGGNIIQLKIENNKPEIYFGEEKLETPDFTRFMSALHNVEGEISEYKGSGNTANPLELALSHDEHLVAKGDKVWVFRGDKPNICRLLGKGQKWCISSTTSATHWFGYRINHGQTQYFVFDFNKAEDDPARYVNPGVAPEGKYSEWVDARNVHSSDPLDENSQIGINGYDSIEEYKNYLESKGIPKSTWKSLPLEDWEKRLDNYYSYGSDFHAAKKDPDPRVFDMFVKIVESMRDDDFYSLTDEQRKEFLLGKVLNITEEQLNYAMDNFRKEYYDSLDFDNKIQLAYKLKDENLLYRLAKTPNIGSGNIYRFIQYAKDKLKMVEVLGKENMDKLSTSDVYYLIDGATDRVQMAEALGKELIDQMTSRDIVSLIFTSSNKAATIKALGEAVNKMSADQIKYLIIDPTNNRKSRMIELLGSLITNKIEKKDAYHFLDTLKGSDVVTMAKFLKKEVLNDLSNQFLLNLIVYNSNGIELMKILGKDKINELCRVYDEDDSETPVYRLLDRASYFQKVEMAEELGKENLNLLSNKEIIKLVDKEGSYERMKKALAEIIKERGIEV